MDNLELKVKTVEALHPMLVELIQNINKITPSAETNECKEKVKNWYVYFHKSYNIIQIQIQIHKFNTYLE